MKKLIAGISILMVLIAWAVLNWPALISLHLRWIRLDDSYAIGYPICAISIWLIIKQWKSIRRVGVSPSIVAGLLFFLAILVGQAGRLVQFQVLQQMMVPVSLWLIIVTACGWRIGRRLLFPFALVYLAIPLWDPIVTPLRWLTTVVTQHVLKILGVPAYISGYEIVLPAGKIIVEDSCSGLNLFLTASVLGFLQCHLMTQRLWRRVSVVLLAMMIGVADNWIRVIIIVLIAHATNMQSPLVYHHGNLGWAVFVVSLIPYFIIARWLERGERVKPLSTIDIAQSTTRYGQAILYTAVAILGGVVVLASSLLLERHAGNASLLPAPPLATSVQPTWLPDYKGYDQQQAWRVYMDGVSYEILVLTYVKQAADKKLIYYSNRIADEQYTLAADKFTASDSLRINQSIINANGPRVVWWFYLIDQHIVTGGLAAKWYQFTGLLRGDQRASLVAISTQCLAADCSDVLLRSDNSLGVRKLLTRWLFDIGVIGALEPTR